MKAYKGFDNTDGKLTCRDFVFEEGKTYEEENAELCKKGFHACEDPLDCLSYYAPDTSEYREVDLEDVSDECGGNSKRVGKKISIGAKINIANICDLHFRYVSERCEHKDIASGYGSANIATDYRSANIASGYGSANIATGYGSANIAADCLSANSATGDRSANSATGYGSANVTTGSESKNEGGIATLNAAWGEDSKCRGKIGAYLVLSEWGDWDGEKHPLLGATMVCVDGETIKEDVWYTMKGGKVIECEEE